MRCCNMLHFQVKWHTHNPQVNQMGPYREVVLSPLPTVKVKLKVTLSLCLINSASHHEGVRGCGVIAPPVFISALDESEGSFTFLSIYPPPPGKNSQYPLESRLSGFQSRFGSCGTQKNLLTLPIIEPQSSNVQADTIPSELSQLPNCLLYYQKPKLFSRDEYSIERNIPCQRQKRTKIKIDWKC
jgi:hypothetical protein